MSGRSMNLGSATLSTPAFRAEPARQSDTEDLPRAYKSLWANTSGSARVIPVENADNEPVNLQVIGGTPVPFAVRRVLTSGTTASLIGVIA